MKNGKLFIKAWLLVGLLDILAAFLSFYISTGKSPLIVLKFIASALLGSAAYSAAGSIWVGLLLHFAVAFLFALFFFIAYKPLKLYKLQWVVLGIVYGIFIWLVMNKLVLPITMVKQQPFKWADAIRAALILITMIGLPLSWILNKAERKG